MSAVATVIKTGIGYISAQNAQNAQTQASDAANQVQQTQWQKEQANIAPYLASGTQNLATLNSSMPDLTRKFTMQDFQQDPGYQFQLSQGLGAIDRSAAAKGMLNSTGTQQNATGYAEGMANTDYQQALMNFQNNQSQRYNMLSGLANMGVQATGMANASNANYANQFSNNLIGAGNARAAGAIGEGNAISGGIAGLTNGYQQSQMMNMIYPQGGSPNGGNSNLVSGNAVGMSTGGGGSVPGAASSWAGADGGAAAAGGASSLDLLLA